MQAQFLNSGVWTPNEMAQGALQTQGSQAAHSHCMSCFEDLLHQLRHAHSCPSVQFVHHWSLATCHAFPHNLDAFLHCFRSSLQFPL
jgi:hypothetical protein